MLAVRYASVRNLCSLRNALKFHKSRYPTEVVVISTARIHNTGLVAVRQRTTPNKDEQKENLKDTTSSSDGSEGADEGKKTAEPQNPFMGISPQKRRFLIIAYFVVSTLLMIVVFTTMSGQQKPFDTPLAGEKVTLDEFLQKFLAAGEVRAIVNYPANHRAIAFLQKDAIIDGKPHEKPTVLIEYNADATMPDQFQREVRAFEQRLGISEQQGVPIEHIQGINTRQIVQLTIAFIIIAMATSAFGRVMAQRYVKEQAAKSAKK
ncbi:hypothetical protein AAVH_04922 [Aphelenchoides avenae]|nr:hypothetical protein AAVH_04922 [Aphelenchus avenae]